MSNIKETLAQRFEEHRIIFWYNEKGEDHIQTEYETLSLDNVEKIHVQGDEFAIKYRVEKVASKDKFLLYFTGEKPAYEDNWLLDLELAHFVFYTDEATMFLQEVGLDFHFKELIEEHVLFFKAKERREKLKDLLGDGDGHQDIRYKMLAVVFNADHIDLTTYIHAHGTEFINDKDQVEKDLKRYKLFDFYWNEIGRVFHYDTSTPTIYDFLMEVFHHSFGLNDVSEKDRESKLILSRWKDTISYRNSFSPFSKKIAKDTNIQERLRGAALDEILGDDVFEIINHRVIEELVSLVSEESISKDKLLQCIKQRENKFWYTDFEHFYKSIEYGARMITMIRQHEKVKYTSFDEGINNYADELFEIDQAYRKFIWHYRNTQHSSILTELAEKVEKVYSNDWLLTYNNNWQTIIDGLEKWNTKALNSQRQFFSQHVKPFIKKGQRLFVIISDALRYECGAELNKLLQSKSFFTASLEPMVTSLPSYTQLGMASLLPHEALSLKEGEETVKADDISSSGVAGRQRVLEANSGVRAKAIQAKDFMKMSATVLKTDFVKDYDLIYIYRNKIDKVGDDKTTENETVDAVEDELKFLQELIQKVFTANGQNMLITADHGFIYQYQAIDDSDYIDVKLKGKSWEKDRRFVIGTNLGEADYAKKFSAQQLNINNEGVEVLFPKSINRLRVSGSGTRYVHGGATPQEIVIPLIKISKKRQKKSEKVNIDIVKSADKITTNILMISFIQSDLVTDIILPRELRVGIYAEDGVLRSNVFNYIFDVEEGSERQREVKHRFQLSAQASGKYKNQRVKLVLEEPIEGTSKWKLYKEYFYTLSVQYGDAWD